MKQPEEKRFLFLLNPILLSVKSQYLALKRRILERDFLIFLSCFQSVQLRYPSATVPRATSRTNPLIRFC